MKYTIEIFDSWGRRVHSLDDVPLLEIVRRQVDGADTVHGILRGVLDNLGPNYTVRVLLEGKLFCEAPLNRVEMQWGENKKLILDRFVHFHEVVGVEAQNAHAKHNAQVAHSYLNRGVCDIARDLINRCPGPLHYTVVHSAYPDAAMREQAKFDARKLPADELELGGIGVGNWVGAARMDASAAFAKDGKTLSGLVVDGIAWPDLRLQFVACEETSLNDAARARHPETESWTSAQYNNSAYKLSADAAKTNLQDLLDTHGVSYIELNPHRGDTGAFDGRVDDEGRYIALLFGGGECFNAAMLELGNAQAELHADAPPFAPELAPKDFYSYTAEHTDSITAPNINVAAFDAQGGVLESLLALSYFSRKTVLHIGAENTLHLRNPEQAARVFYFQPERMGISWGTQMGALANLLRFSGNPLDGALELLEVSVESLAEFGEYAVDFPFYTLSQVEDAQRMLPILMEDIAHPEITGKLVFFQGDNSLDIGDLLEVRGAPLRRISRSLPGEWGEEYTGRLLGLVSEVRHVFTGKHTRTEVALTSPQRSVASPIAFMLRGQRTLRSVYAFRLDDPAVALDEGFNLN